MHECYRSKDQIVKQILSAIKEHESRGGREGDGIRITKLLYLSRLSNNQLKTYLNDLQKVGLITCDTIKSRIIAASNYRRQHPFDYLMRGCILIATSCHYYRVHMIATHYAF